eukprot:COSAG05_NODE_121_length_17719_cov_168.686266_6_plen_298_part_00
MHLAHTHTSPAPCWAHMGANGSAEAANADAAIHLEDVIDATGGRMTGAEEGSVDPASSADMISCSGSHSSSRTGSPHSVHDEFSDLNLNLTPRPASFGCALQLRDANVSLPNADVPKSPVQAKASPQTASAPAASVDELSDLAALAGFTGHSKGVEGLGAVLAEATRGGGASDVRPPKPREEQEEEDDDEAKNGCEAQLCFTTDEDEALMRQILMDQSQTPASTAKFSFPGFNDSAGDDMGGSSFSAASVPNSVASSVEPIESLETMRNRAAQDVRLKNTGEVMVSLMEECMEQESG